MATKQRSDDPKADVAAVIDGILAKHGATREQWDSTSVYAVCVAARVEVAGHFRGLGWSSTRIADAIGVTRSTVRRLLRTNVEAPVVAPPTKSTPRKLPVVTGPSMINKRGERRDCTRESECLRALLKQYDPHAPPMHSSCPVGCQWFTRPNMELRRYDATIRHGGGVAV